MVIFFILGLVLAVYGYFFAIKFTKYKPYPRLSKTQKEENLKNSKDLDSHV
jgi:hypothetical protein